MIYGKLTQQTEFCEIIDMTKSEGASDFISVMYTAYEDLPNFYSNQTSFETIFQILLSNTKDKLDWKAHFDVIDSLRILNKYQSSDLLRNISLFIPFLQQGIDSLRSNVSKNSLLFVKELINRSCENPPSEELILKILPMIIDKALSDKAFIKNEAKSAIKEFEKHGCWDVTIYILGEKSYDKNSNICELSMQTLLQVVKNTKENLAQKLTKNGLKILFRTLAKNLEGKRALMKKMSEETIKTMYGYIPKNGSTLEDYLMYEMELDLPEIQLIQAALHDKKNKQSKGELLKFIQDKKMKKEEENKINVKSINMDKIKDIPLVASMPEI